MYMCIYVYIYKKGNFFMKKDPQNPPYSIQSFSKFLKVFCIKIKLSIIFAKGSTIQLSNAI